MQILKFNNLKMINKNEINLILKIYRTRYFGKKIHILSNSSLVNKNGI